MKIAWETVTVDDSPMRLYLCQPESAVSLPAVVVIQNQDGVGEFTQEMTRRVAEAGYVAIAPELYHRNTPEVSADREKRTANRRDDQVINDVNTAVNFLRGCAAADVNRLGIIGFCMGGRVAFLMAAANPMFRAAVDYYGGGVYKAWGNGPAPADLSAKISCPIQGHFGELDKSPSPEEMRRPDEELTKLSKAHEFYFYPNAGHAFNRKGWNGYRREADTASWPRTLDFFSKHLNEAAPKKAAAR